MSGYESAVVRVLKSVMGRPIVGMGVLVGAREMVTCAHVVNTALGLDQRRQTRPDESTPVQVEFPLLPGEPIRLARVAAWVPQKRCP